MSDWRALDQELDAWGRGRDVATLWWRDDDAVAATPALQRLLALTDEAGKPPIPLCLAVVPAGAMASLPGLLSPLDHVSVLQHGYTHVNHGSDGAKKAEFPPGRDLTEMLADLRTGRKRLLELFKEQALPALVPPWNRIAPALVDRLPEVDLVGLSTYGPRRHDGSKAAVLEVNTHIDIMNWHSGRRFLGVDAALKLAIDHLAARRQNRVEKNEATGLLTHHLVHDDEAWVFIDTFLRRTVRHAAVRWLDGRALFDRPDEARR